MTFSAAIVERKRNYPRQSQGSKRESRQEDGKKKKGVEGMTIIIIRQKKNNTKRLTSLFSSEKSAKEIQGFDARFDSSSFLKNILIPDCSTREQ